MALVTAHAQTSFDNTEKFAWSANTGWINFGWADPSDPNRPRVDLLTGAFTGHAWSGNTGWINLGTGLLTAKSMDDSDTDNDGIADAWEHFHFGNLTTAGETSDHDEDGAGDLSEHHAGTDPKDPASYLKIVTHTYNGDLTEATATFTTTPTRLYRLEYSTDLGISEPWTDSGLGTFAPDAGDVTTRAITFPTGPRRFLRAIAIKPLSTP